MAPGGPLGAVQARRMSGRRSRSGRGVVLCAPRPVRGRLCGACGALVPAETLDTAATAASAARVPSRRRRPTQFNYKAE